MASASELKQIRNLIFGYKDTATREEKEELKKILEHELNLLNKDM